MISIPLQIRGLTWLGDWSLLADQPGNGWVVARNDQFFTGGELVHDLLCCFEFFLPLIHAREFASETFVCWRLNGYNALYGTRSASPA